MPAIIRVPFTRANYLTTEECASREIPLRGEMQQSERYFSTSDGPMELEFIYISYARGGDYSQQELKHTNQLNRAFSAMVHSNVIQGPFYIEDMSGRGVFQTGLILFDQSDINAVSARFPQLRKKTGVADINPVDLNQVMMVYAHTTTGWTPSNVRLARYCEKQKLFKQKPTIFEKFGF